MNTQRIKHSFLYFLKHPLFAGSMVMIIGNNFVNLVNFIYTLLMGRMLGPSDYGTLASLLSLTGLVGMIPFSLGLVIIKFISSAKSDEDSKILINWFNKRIMAFSIAVALFLVLISPVAASFLNIKNSFLIVLIGFYFLFSFPAFYNRSVLQGLLKFKETVITVILENSTKLIFSVLAVMLGYSLLGVVGVYASTGFIGWIITRRFIKNYFEPITKSPKQLKSIFFYAIPVLIQSISITALYSTDLILVKHYFSAFDAGLYASLSTLGKIVFFGASPVAAVMFPIISKRQSKGENYSKIFMYSLALTTLISLFVLLLYKLFPNIAILILFGKDYLTGADLLFWSGLFMAIYTLNTVFINFFLSLGQTRVVVMPVVAAIAQVIGIMLFHETLFQVIQVSTIVVSLLLVTLSIYFFLDSKNHS